MPQHTTERAAYILDQGFADAEHSDASDIHYASSPDGSDVTIVTSAHDGVLHATIVSEGANSMAMRFIVRPNEYAGYHAQDAEVATVVFLDPQGDDCLICIPTSIEVAEQLEAHARAAFAVRSTSDLGNCL